VSTSPRIVVLDGATLNPGDLGWSALAELGQLELHDRTPEAEVVNRALGAAILLTNKTPLSAATIAALPGLRYIGVLATGYNVVDVGAARARGIPVCNVPLYGTQSVAQHVFALLLELTNRVGEHAASVREGRWARSPDFCYWNGSLVELDGLTLGIVGSGRIGTAVGRLGEAFGLRIVFARRQGGRAELEQVLRSADVVSLHCPLTDTTRALINAETLAWMKSSAFLINTSRGLLIDEAALASALARGGIAGAALDVLSTEPPPADHPLSNAPNCVVTPHIAWATRAARARLMSVATANVKSFLEGNPRNVIT